MRSAPPGFHILPQPKKCSGFPQLRAAFTHPAYLAAMMIKTDNDVLVRTMANLRFVEEAAKRRSPVNQESQVFEVTQLVNSFLMTVLKNWDGLEVNWSQLSQSGVNWPTIETSKANQSARQCIGKLRDALAHGLFVFEDDGSGEIAAMHFWTCPDRKGCNSPSALEESLIPKALGRGMC